VATKGADRRPQCRNAVSSRFPISTAIQVRNFNKGMGGLAEAQGHGGASAIPGSLPPMPPEAVERKSGSVLRARRNRMLRAIATLYSLRPVARPSAAPTCLPSRSTDCPKTWPRAPSPEWLGKKVLAAAGVRVVDGDPRPHGPTKRSQWPGASAIPVVLKGAGPRPRLSAQNRGPAASS